MDHKLIRFATHGNMGTFGMLSCGDDYHMYTIERPWMSNTPFVSCIPAGDYLIEGHSSEKHPNSYAIVSRPENLDEEGITHYQNPDSKRYAILIHSGNTMTDIEGCIAPGLALGALQGQWAVLSSRAAMKKLNKYMRPGDTLRIEWHKAEGK